MDNKFYPHLLVSLNKWFFIMLIFIGLAGYSQSENQKPKGAVQTFYFTANTGFKDDTSSKILTEINKASQLDNDAKLVLIGNIVPPGGYPPKNKKRELRCSNTLEGIYWILFPVLKVR